jgi:peptidoglycan/LPS O-acetylase OafA/YrhL
MLNPGRILYVDAWRFIAIALVIASHIVEFSHPWYKENAPGLAWRLQGAGMFGVQIFFCISGFVICRGTLSELAKTGSVNIKGFYIRRFFRIVPPLLVYFLGVGALVTAGIAEVNFGQFVQSSLFLCNISALGSCSWWLGHTWSLAYEEQFYLLFPLLVMGTTLAVKPARRRFLMGAAGLILLACCALIAGVHGLAKYVSTLNFMLSGCVFAAYWHNIEPFAKRQSPFLWAFIATGTFGVGCFFAISDLVRQVLTASIMPFAICITVFGTPIAVPAIGKIFLSKWIGHLGKISFSVYLWQQLATANYGQSSVAFVYYMLIAVFAFALVSYQYFELPLIQTGARVAKKFGFKATNDLNRQETTSGLESAPQEALG